MFLYAFLSDNAGMHVPFLLSLCIILFGYFLKRIGFLEADDSGFLSKIVMNLTFPAQILLNFSSAPIQTELLLVPFIPVLSGFAGLGMAVLLFRKQPDHLRGLMYMGAIGLNIGLFAFPILRGLFGDLGVQVASMVDISNAFIIFGLSYMVGHRCSPLTGNHGRGFWGTMKIIFRSVPMIAYIVSLTINLSGLALPSFAVSWLTIIGKANQFFVLLVLGLVLNFNWRHHITGGLIPLILLRYAMALVLVALVWFLLPAAEILRKIICLCLILPTPFVLVPYSIEFGYNRDMAGAVMNLTLVISFFLMWGLMIVL